MKLHQDCSKNAIDQAKLWLLWQLKEKSSYTSKWKGLELRYFSQGISLLVSTKYIQIMVKS
jgi:hypothetical protein